MQNNIVKSFRQRLIRHGFTDVSIYEEVDGYYRILCSKGNNHFTERVHISIMPGLPYHVFFKSELID